MSVWKIESKEGNLLNILEEINPLEWRKYQQRHPEVWVNGNFERKDCSSLPPFVAFRFEQEKTDILNKLTKAIESYAGTVSWVLDGHKRDGLPGVNWIIFPSRIREVEKLAEELNLTPYLYLAKYEPNFGPIAYDDLVGLTEYIKEIFQL